MSVIQYAVESLKVKHIIVCGHYGCGGIHAALLDNTSDPISTWLKDIKDVYQSNRDKLDSIDDENEMLNLLSELNVAKQVHNVSNTPSVRSAWESGRELSVHGWIYSIEDGMLKDLGVSVNSAHETPET
jgi:carbonic anhydrase